MTSIASLEPQLIQGLQQLLLPASLSARLLDYLALLHRWNATYNLTAIRDPQEMLSKHLLDSLSMHAYVTHATLADLGTGPGLPGIPLAIAKPQLQVSLVESNGKKARFLREAVRQLKLDNARVIESRAEDVNQSGQYEAITARALDRLNGILEVGAHLLTQNGQLLAMKAARVQEEIDELPAEWECSAIHDLHVPGLVGERHLLVIQRKKV
jgi:16S rRNA (guanine527-N7)-methyltransferase